MDIKKIMAFYTTTTAQLVAKMGTEIRDKIKSNYLSRSKKGFITQPDTTEDDLIKEAERVENVKTNRRKFAFGVEELRHLLALTRSRTEVTYGHSHWCHNHDKFVQHENLDECDCITPREFKISSITWVLDGKNSMGLVTGLIIVIEIKYRDHKTKIGRAFCQRYLLTSSREVKVEGVTQHTLIAES